MVTSDSDNIQSGGYIKITENGEYSHARKFAGTT